VKLILQYKNGTDVPYAIFGRNHFMLKPGENAAVIIEQGAKDCMSGMSGVGSMSSVGGLESECEVCAEAWNGEAVCVGL
jgi:hypothetical protein